MSEDTWFVLRPQKAQAFGRPEGNKFIVRKGSTAMLDGSPRVKRDREERDRLVRQGVLVPDSDPDLKDGNCSGPQSWRRPTDGKTLKEAGG